MSIKEHKTGKSRLLLLKPFFFRLSIIQTASSTFLKHTVEIRLRWSEHFVLLILNKMKRAWMLTLLTFCSAVGDSIFSQSEMVASSPEFELEPSEVLLHKYQLMSITRRVTTTGRTFCQTRKYMTGNLRPITDNNVGCKQQISKNCCQRTPLY